MSRTPLEIIDGAIRVIQAQSKTSGDGADHQADELRKARAAVTELIEADTAYDKAREAHWETYHSGGMVTHRETHRELEAAKKRRAAALARAGGA